jgi:hypothetical protein
VTAGELVLVVAAVLCSIGFAALIVVLLRVLDALKAVQTEVDDLRAETTPLIRELLVSTDDARAAVLEARADLERFDQVLGSAEAIGDAVGGRVARTTFSTPVIKAAGFVRGTSRTLSRLRGAPPSASVGPTTPQLDARRRAIEVGEETDRRRRKRA